MEYLLFPPFPGCERGSYSCTNSRDISSATRTVRAARSLSFPCFCTVSDCKDTSPSTNGCRRDTVLDQPGSDSKPCQGASLGARYSKGYSKALEYKFKVVQCLLYSGQWRTPLAKQRKKCYNSQTKNPN
jgi:hypothetical protein